MKTCRAIIYLQKFFGKNTGITFKFFRNGFPRIRNNRITEKQNCTVGFYSAVGVLYDTFAGINADFIKIQ